ncbi:MAG TPA: DUF3467 domain-containing protein [Nitrospirota bacterium]
MGKNDKEVPGQLTFEITPEVEGGVYSNVASVVHNPNEFIFDFAVVLPGKNAAKVRARVITNPAHAKQFMMALEENVSRYEKAFGEIKQPAAGQGVMPTRTVH